MMFPRQGAVDCKGLSNTHPYTYLYLYREEDIRDGRRVEWNEGKKENAMDALAQRHRCKKINVKVRIWEKRRRRRRREEEKKKRRIAAVPTLRNVADVVK